MRSRRLRIFRSFFLSFSAWNDVVATGHQPTWR